MFLCNLVSTPQKMIEHQIEFYETLECSFRSTRNVVWTRSARCQLASFRSLYPSSYGQVDQHHHYHNPLLAELLMQYFWFIGPVTSFIVCFGVWFYPTVRLVLEMRNGIVTEKSYPRLKPIFFAGRDRAVPAGTAE